MIPIVVRVLLERRKKRLNERDISGRIKTIQTTALLKSAKILRKILENLGDLLSLRL